MCVCQLLCDFSMILTFLCHHSRMRTGERHRDSASWLAETLKTPAGGGRRRKRRAGAENRSPGARLPAKVLSANAALPLNEGSPIDEVPLGNAASTDICKPGAGRVCLCARVCECVRANYSEIMVS